MQLWQRCRTHFVPNLLTRVSKRSQPGVATLVRTISDSGARVLPVGQSHTTKPGDHVNRAHRMASSAVAGNPQTGC